MPRQTGKPEKYRQYNAPVAIGGVGGSGTRLITAIAENTGFFMGNDRNPAGDNLAFTLLFKQRNLWPLDQNHGRIHDYIRIFLDTVYSGLALSAGDIHTIRSLTQVARLNAPKDWLQQRAEALINAPHGAGQPAPWGWKEPNTHIFLPALIDRVPGLKYIHVMRHGLDMAYSANQAQVHFWGEALTGIATTDGNPEESFRYWCAVHRRIIDIGAQMGSGFLLINFDDFCANPQAGMARLIQFLGVTPSAQCQEQLMAMVREPASVGRHRRETRMDLPEEDLALLETLGFRHHW